MMRKISILCAFVLILLPVLVSCDNKAPHNVNNTTSVPSEETPSVVSAMPTNEPATPTPTVTVEPTMTPEPTPTSKPTATVRIVELWGVMDAVEYASVGSVCIDGSLWDTIQYNHQEKAMYPVTIGAQAMEYPDGSYLDRNGIVTSELERIRNSGILIFRDEEKRLLALVTEEQIRLLAPEDGVRAFYEIGWVKGEKSLLENVSKFAVITPTPVPTPKNPVRIDGCGGKISSELYGDYEADEYVKILVGLGDEYGTAWQQLKERYPEEYEAYEWIHIVDYSKADPDDPRWEMAGYAWNVLRVQILEELRAEWRGDFFARHPEWAQYQLDHDSWFVLKVPYSLIPEIAKDPEVTGISWRRYTDTSDIRIIGEYDGCPVYGYIYDD